LPTFVFGAHCERSQEVAKAFVGVEVSCHEEKFKLKEVIVVMSMLLRGKHWPGNRPDRTLVV